MKNNIFILTIMLTLTIASTFAFDYDIPEISTAPTLNGVLAAGEWDDAISFEISYPDIVTSPNVGTLNGPAPADDADISAVWYFMWDEDSLYVAVEVLDETIDWDPAPADGLNGGDCAQFCFSMLNDQSLATVPIIDFVAETSDSAGPSIYARGYWLPNAAIGGVVGGGGYQVEVAIPWDDFDSDYSPLPGDVHALSVINTDFDSGVETYLTNTGNGVWSNSFNIANWHTMTLVDSDGCGANGRLDTDFNGDCVVNVEDFAALALNWMVSTVN